jgi:hypothetical protein
MALKTVDEVENLVERLDVKSNQLSDKFVKSVQGILGDILKETEDYIMSGLQMTGGNIVYTPESLSFAMQAADSLIKHMQDAGYSAVVQNFVSSYHELIPLSKALYEGVGVGKFEWTAGQVSMLHELQKFQVSYLTEEPFRIPAAIIQQALYESVLAGTPYSQLKAQIAGELELDKKFERHMSTYAHDATMQFSRTMDAVSMKDTGFYYYAGTAIKTSRSFCINNVGGIYDEAEVNSWNAMNWQGKAPGDVKISLGGYNCRHRLIRVSKEFALANGYVEKDKEGK